MSMNLIQIQERLKDVPTQAVMQYANGMNPDIPPYMALSEMDRRKRIQQQAQAQAPQGTVKEQLEQQVAGIGGLVPPGAQMPGQQQGAPQGAPQGMPPAMAQRPMPPGMPPQGAPMRAAGGGLMSLMGNRYANGGMVAFSDSGKVKVDDEDGEDGDDKTVLESESQLDEDASMTPGADLAALKKMMAESMKSQVTKPLSPLERRKKMIEEDPENYGVLAVKPGAEYLSGIQAMLQQREAEAEKQRGENSRLKELGTYAAISKAAEATRGMRGGRGSQIAAMLGSFGQQLGGIEKESVGREQALREDLLKRQELQNAAKFEVEKLQIARAQGDVAGEQQHAENIAKLENALRVSKNNMLKSALTGAYGAKSKIDAANILAKSREKVAGMRGASEKKPTDLGNMIQIEFDALVANGADASDPNTKRIAAQNAARALSKSAGSTRAETEQIRDANAEFLSRTMLERRALNQLRTSNPTAYATRIKEIRDEIKAEFGIEPTAQPRTQTNASAAAPSTKPPAASSGTPPVNLLKEGVETNFKNGQTWTLKNGKPVQVK